MAMQIAGAGAVHTLHAYAAAIDTALGHLATAEAMPIRKFFADGQRLERGRVLNDATSSMSDALTAALHLRDITGVSFALDAKQSLLQAKLAYRSLGDVPEVATLRAEATQELQRVSHRATLVAGLAPGAGAADRAPVLAVVSRAVAGDAAAHVELRDSFLAGVTSDRILRTGEDAVAGGGWAEDEAVAQRVIERIIASGDVAVADQLLQAATSRWSSGVGESVLDMTVTTPNDARLLVGAARRELDRLTSVDPVVAPLIASTRELIDFNARRLGTSVDEGSGLGYLDHPDYAELGRVQASLRLLRSLDAVQHAPQPSTAPAAPITDDAIAW